MLIIRRVRFCDGLHYDISGLINGLEISIREDELKNLIMQTLDLMLSGDTSDIVVV